MDNILANNELYKIDSNLLSFLGGEVFLFSSLRVVTLIYLKDASEIKTGN